MNRNLMLTCVALLLLLFSDNIFAEDSNGKLSGCMFGDYFYVLKNHDTAIQDMNGVQFRRIYFTYDQKLSDKFSTRVRMEMKSAGDFSTKAKMVPFVKDAYLSWKASSKLQLILGISPTPTLEMIDKIWGYRSVEKTPLDLQKFATSRDFGIALRGYFDENGKIRYRAMFANGNGVSSETNKGKKAMFSLGFYPDDRFMVEFYSDWAANTGQTDWFTYQVFASYKTSNLRVGIQYAQQTRQTEIGDDLSLSIGSVFFVTKVTEKANLFARIDRQFDPNPKGDKIAYIPFDNTAKSIFLVVGLDFAPIKTVHMMPNVELVKYDENDAGVTPDTDIIPRLTFYYKF